MAYQFIPVVDPADSTFSEVLGINDAGTLAGFYGSGTPAAAHPSQAFAAGPVYAPGSFNSLAASISTVPGTQSEATGTNNLGTIVVGFETNASSVTSGFYLKGSTATTVTVSGSTDLRLLGVNDAGLAVGYYVNGTGHDVAFTVNTSTGGTPQTLAIAGSTSTRATGINVANVICGIAVIGGVTEGFILQGKSPPVFLKGPAGAKNATAVAINNQGQVAGDYTDAAGVRHGFVYDEANGSYTTIDNPTAVAGTTVVTGINDQGQVVGYYKDGQGHTDGFLATPDGIATISNPGPGSILVAGPLSAGLSVTGSAAVTIIDPGWDNLLLVANSGSDTLIASGGFDTLVGGAGNDTLIALATSDTLVAGTGHDVLFAAGADVVFLGSGSDTVAVTGASTVVAGGGSDTVYAAAGTIVYGNGPSSSLTVYSQNTAGAGYTVVAGDAATVRAYGGPGGGDLLFAGGNLGFATLVGGSGGLATIVGGSGSNYLADGTGGAVIFAGAGGNTLVGTAVNTVFVGNGAGGSTIQAGGAGEQVFLQGASNNEVVVTASSGNLSLVASGSSGANFMVLGSAAVQLFEGSGNTTAVVSSGTATVVGGAGIDSYVLQSNASGATTIVGFKPGVDVVDLTGVSTSQLNADLAGARDAHGSTTISVGSATIEFFGIQHATAGYFHLG